MELKIKTNWTPDIKKNNHLKRKSLHEDLQEQRIGTCEIGSMQMSYSRER